MTSKRDNIAASRSWLKRLRKVLTSGPEDRSQLVQLLRDAQQAHLIDADALTMIEGVLQVAEMQVRDIMIPRSQMIVVEHDAVLEDIMPILTESGHSRFPVIGDSHDEMLGILLAKDLLSYFNNDELRAFNVRDIVRPVVFIPESKRLNVLLKEFRSSRNHMAVVVNEYGGVDGLVTIEDVLEQIVGDIADEHDIDESVYILKHSERRFTIKALTPIEEFNEHFHTRFSDEDFDTIGGLVTRQFGHLPKRGEAVLINEMAGLPEGLGLSFKVLHADGRRLHLLKLTLQHSDAQTHSE